MTDKEQIMIDGVNVSECEFYVHYDYGKFPHGCSLHKDMFGLPVCCDVADCCKNCYFKQLARKTQECESLKQEIEILQNNFDTVTRDCNDETEILKQECEEYKKRAVYFKDVNKQLGYKYLTIKHECEELKKQLKTSEKWRINAESLNEKLDIKNTHYRKALEEIEDNINKYFEEGFYKNCRYAKECTKACGLATNRVLNKTLDIINKAKGMYNENT